MATKKSENSLLAMTRGIVLFIAEKRIDRRFVFGIIGYLNYLLGVQMTESLSQLCEIAQRLADENQVEVRFSFVVRPKEVLTAVDAANAIENLLGQIHDLDDCCRELLSENWITVSRAAEYFELPDADPERAIRTMIERGELYAEREGRRRWKISAASCVFNVRGINDPRLTLKNGKKTLN